MKKIFFCLGFFCISLKVFGDDVTASVTNAGIGTTDGAITLLLTSGYAPFTFLWTGPDGFISTEQNIDALAAGEYCVTVNDLYCGVANLCITVEEELKNAISDLYFSDLVLSPNPFTSGFNVIFDCSTSGNYNFVLYDILGNKIFATQFAVNSGNNNIPFEIPVVLPEGNYFFSILDEGEHTISKQVVSTK